MTFPWEPYQSRIVSFVYGGTEEERVSSMEAVFLFSLVWTLGGSLDMKERKASAPYSGGRPGVDLDNIV